MGGEAFRYSRRAGIDYQSVADGLQSGIGRTRRGAEEAEVIVAGGSPVFFSTPWSVSRRPPSNDANPKARQNHPDTVYGLRNPPEQVELSNHLRTLLLFIVEKNGDTSRRSGGNCEVQAAVAVQIVGHQMRRHVARLEMAGGSIVSIAVAEQH
jgi:hypothetical protein